MSIHFNIIIKLQLGQETALYHYTNKNLTVFAMLEHLYIQKLDH